MAFVPWCAQWQHGVVAEMQTDAAAIEKLAMRPSATQSLSGNIKRDYKVFGA